MIIGILIVSIALILVILINRALKHNSKDCEFNLEINIKGFSKFGKASLTKGSDPCVNLPGTNTARNDIFIAVFFLLQKFV